MGRPKQSGLVTCITRPPMDTGKRLSSSRSLCVVLGGFGLLLAAGIFVQPTIAIEAQAHFFPGLVAPANGLGGIRVGGILRRVVPRKFVRQRRAFWNQ